MLDAKTIAAMLAGPLEELVIAFQDHPSPGVVDTLRRARLALAAYAKNKDA